MTGNAKTAHVAHLLPGYVVGTLDAADRGSARAHLAGCPACRAELAAWHAIQQAARDAYRYDAPTDDETLHQVWRRIDAATGRAQPFQLSTTDPAAPTGQASPNAVERHIFSPSRAGRPLAFLATAALIVLTLVGSFLIFGPDRPGRQHQEPVFLPALSGTPATPDPVNAETLLDATIAAVPAEPGIIVFKRLTLQPSPEPLVVLPLTGPVFVLVESGELTATVAGTAHRLAAGAAFSPAEPEQEVALRATGTEEAVAFLVYLQSGPDLPFPRDFTVHTLEVLLSRPTEARLGCPCRLLLDRFTLSPGSALPPQEAIPLTWFALGEGVLGVMLEGEDLPYLFTSGEEREFRVGQFLPLDLAPPGTHMTLRNAGDDPLVLYRLTLTPSGAGGSAGATPNGRTPDLSD